MTLILQGDTSAITTGADNAAVLVPDGATGDVLHRLGKYAAYLDTTGAAWHEVNLAAYRDHLLAEGLTPSSVSAHLSTVRGRLRRLLREPATRDAIISKAAYSMPDASLSDVLALANEKIERIKGALDPDAARVKTETVQDRVDSEHVRLTPHQAGDLANAPGTHDLQGLRDTALIALMLATGIRAAEAAALEVKDLRQRKDGKLALHVRHGKGNKTRAVPYGALDGALVLVDAWMQRAGIESGRVFRSMDNSGALYDAMSTRAIERMYDRYPIVIDGKRRTVKPHDIRRTYARNQYLAGMPILAISENLGHASTETTRGYIGGEDMERRAGRAYVTFPTLEAFLM